MKVKSSKYILSIAFWIDKLTAKYQVGNNLSERFSK